MATFYRTGVETYSIIGTADEKDSLEGKIPDGSTYFAVDENMFYTFYDGQWYETLPEAARLYHDDVGTDTKPIKLVGGVATVVANELAEDAKVVHNTGNETIAGIKTFTNRVIQRQLSPTYWMVSNADYQSNTWKGYIRTSDQKDGASTIHSDIIAQTETGNNSVRISVYTPDRSNHYDMSVRAFSDHQIVQAVPYYPVDGSDNPQAIPTNAVMLSGNIAVDPRIVHTTGVETIAGQKTFTGDVVVPTYTGSDTDRAMNKAMLASHLANDSTLVHTTGTETIAGQKTFTENLYVNRSTNNANLYLQSTGIYNRLFSRKYNVGGTAYDDVWEIGPLWGSSTASVTNIRSYAPRATLGDTDETQAYLNVSLRANNTDSGLLAVNYSDTSGSSVNIDLLKFENGAVSLYGPTYTADNNADTRVVNRSMLAQIPTVVHTTGVETIAGNKTFTGDTAFDGTVSKKRASVIIGSNKWRRLYSIVLTGNQSARFKLGVHNYSQPALIDDKAACRLFGNGGYMLLMDTYNPSVNKLAICQFETGHFEIWAGNGASGSQSWDVDVDYYQNVPPTVDVSSTDADNYPQVGESGCTASELASTW